MARTSGSAGIAPTVEGGVLQRACACGTHRDGVCGCTECARKRNGSAVGANVQTVGFDVARLQDRVLYRDNEQTLDTAGLLVPEPAAI